MTGAYHIRVLIPCYKEPADIVRKTVEAIRAAALPEGMSLGPLSRASFKMCHCLAAAARSRRASRAPPSRQFCVAALPEGAAHDCLRHVLNCAMC